MSTTSVAPPSLARASGTLLVGRVIGSVGFLVVVVILARSLGPTGRGTLAFVTVVALLATRVSSLGLGGTAVVFAAQRPHARAALLTSHVVFVTAAAAALVGVIAGFLALVPGARPAGVDGFLLAILVPGAVLVALVEWGLAFLLGARLLGAQATAMAIGPWLYALALVSVAAVDELDIESAAVAWLLSGAAWSALILVVAVAAVGFARPSAGLLRESVRFGAGTWVGGLARSVNTRLDQVLLAYLSTQAALGIYAVAVNVGEVLQYAPGAIAMAFAPAVAAAAAAERCARTLQALRAGLLVTSLSIVPAMAVGSLLIPPLFGDEFRDAVVPFLLLAPGALGFVGMRIFSSALMACALPGRSSLPAGAALVTGLALDVILIPPYDAVGAAVASSVGLFVGAAVGLVLYRRVERFGLAEIVPRTADVLGIVSRLSRPISRARRSSPAA